MPPLVLYWQRHARTTGSRAHLPVCVLCNRPAPPESRASLQADRINSRRIGQQPLNQMLSSLSSFLLFPWAFPPSFGKAKNPAGFCKSLKNSFGEFGVAKKDRSLNFALLIEG